VVVAVLINSTGNADGLGEVRKRELVKSGLQLGLRSSDDVLVIEDSYAGASSHLFVPKAHFFVETFLTQCL
jgi:hypothetical protein